MAKEKLKKEYFEILLEEIRDQVKLVLEGHSVLDNKIERLGVNLSEQIQEIRQNLFTLSERVNRLDQKIEKIDQKLEKIDQKLDEHIRQPAHVGV